MSHFPEPCGCSESDALREILECLVVYNEDCDPCNDPDCECGFCEGRRLLDALERKRDEYRNGSVAASTQQPKQGEFKWA